jgi:hypothetical protein
LYLTVAQPEAGMANCILLPPRDPSKNPFFFPEREFPPSRSSFVDPADKLGVDHKTFSKWLLGKAIPTREVSA